MYYGCQVIFKTSNGGQSWSVISPDLSTNDPSRIVSSGGIVEDNLGQFYGEVVFAIAPSEIQRGLIWAGTNDGQVWNTKDGGGNWTNVTKNMTGLPTWGTIRKIEPSHFDPATAYVAIDFHMMDNRKPFIYKTTDFGQTWTNITGDLPSAHPLDYVMSVAENPNRKGMLFAGTGHNFFYSLDDGAHWKQFNEGLPHTAVSWIVVPKQWHDVVVSTYGRGIYILRDIAPLEQHGPNRRRRRRCSIRRIRDIDRRAAAAPTSRSRSRRRRHGRRASRSSTRRTRSFARCRRRRAPASIARRGICATIRRASSRCARRRRTTRTSSRSRDSATVRRDRSRTGEFRARRRADRSRCRASTPCGSSSMGRPNRSRSTILKDPDIKTVDADLVASAQAQVRVRDDLNATADMVNKLEVMRKQIVDQQKANAEKTDVVAALTELDKKMLAVELQLVSRSDLNSDDKYYVEPYKVYMNLIWLNGVVGNGAGDVAGGADFAPTESALDWLGDIEKDLDAAKAAYKKLIESDLDEFNKRMTGKIPAITDTVRPVVP